MIEQQKRRSRLENVADDILQRTNGDFARALAQFTEVLETDRELRAAMVESYLRARSPEVRDDSLRESGQVSHENQEVCAFLSQAPTGVGRYRDADRSATLPLPTLAPLRSGGRLIESASQKTAAPPASRPNPPRALAARLISRTETARTVLDSFRVRDGRAIGDLQWHELTKLARTNESEARVLRYVAEHIANAPSHAKVRDIVKPVVLEAAIKHAEAVNAAA